MNKKDKEFDEMGLVPELFDGKHQIDALIQIIVVKSQKNNIIMGIKV